MGGVGWKKPRTSSRKCCLGSPACGTYALSFESGILGTGVLVLHCFISHRVPVPACAGLCGWLVSM